MILPSWVSSRSVIISRSGDGVFSGPRCKICSLAFFGHHLKAQERAHTTLGSMRDCMMYCSASCMCCAILDLKPNVWFVCSFHYTCSYGVLTFPWCVFNRTFPSLGYLGSFNWRETNIAWKNQEHSLWQVVNCWADTQHLQLHTSQVHCAVASSLIC